MIHGKESQKRLDHFIEVLCWIAILDVWYCVCGMNDECTVVFLLDVVLGISYQSVMFGGLCGGRGL